MPQAYKIPVVWTGLAGAPYLTTLWVNAGLHTTPAAAQTVASGIASNLAEAVFNGMSWTLPSEISLWSAPDTLVSFHAVTGTTQPCTQAGSLASRATQGLIRLRTDGTWNNKRVQGRIFVPGVVTSMIEGATGNPTAGYMTELNAAGAVMDGGSLVVASRATNTFFEVTTATAWNKFAVLRSRRD